jgi:hypothetical protein
MRSFPTRPSATRAFLGQEGGKTALGTNMLGYRAPIWYNHHPKGRGKSVHVKKYPFLLRALLAALVLGCLAVYLILWVGIIAIVAMLSERGAHPEAWPVVGAISGAILGAFGTFYVSRHFEKQRLEKENRTIAASLHAELVDRAARCANDYVAPWRDVQQSRPPAKLLGPDWVEKFRPVESVVYLRVSDKLGMLPSDALFSVVQFYFRLDAVRREIDGIVRDFTPGSDIKVLDYARLGRVALRFYESLTPVLTALERLNVDRALDIETEADASYPQLRERNLAFREALARHPDRTLNLSRKITMTPRATLRTGVSHATASPRLQPKVADVNVRLRGQTLHQDREVGTSVPIDVTLNRVSIPAEDTSCNWPTCPVNCDVPMKVNA